jgi:hypothetical protein
MCADVGHICNLAVTEWQPKIVYTWRSDAWQVMDGETVYCEAMHGEAMRFEAMQFKAIPLATSS